MACPVNSYRAFGEQELACVPCASGSTTQHNASDSSALCVVCPAGAFVTEAGDCRPCPEHAGSLPGTVGSCQCDAGYAFEGDSCVPCAAGHYKALSGNSVCAACAAGKIGTDVPERTHENVSCVGCPANTYWALAGTIPECVNCGTNSHAAAGSLNATSCQCNAGYYAASGSCQACAPGTFKDVVSSDVACSPCGGSTYTPFSAATECLSCPGNSTGHALSNDAELDCKCDPGFTGSDGGPCAACEPGKFKTVAGNQTCADCGPYAFWPLHADPTQNQCQSCPAHSARAPDAHGLNILDCHCEAGHWRANESTCLQCPINFYCSGSLLACPLHSVSAAGSALIDHCRCEAGFFGDTSSCAACPANAFCPEDALSPLSCPPNSTTLGLISATSVSECTCHAGFHRDETIGVRCRPCGEIAPCEGWETVACPPNSTAPWSATELSECVCDPGFQSSLFAVLTLSTTISNPPCTTTSNLVAHYSFDDSGDMGKDSNPSTTKYHLTPTVAGGTGGYDSALKVRGGSFKATNDGDWLDGSFALKSIYDNSVSGISVSVWFYKKSATTYDNPYNTQLFQFYKAGTSLEFAVAVGHYNGVHNLNWATTYSTGQTYANNWAPSQTLDTWHHLVVSLSKTGIFKAYFNGVNLNLVVGSGQGSITAYGGSAYPVPQFADVDKLRIFRPADLKFSGNVDEFSVFNKELSQSEVTELYNACHEQAAQNDSTACVSCHAQEVCRGGVSTQCAGGATNVNFRCVCASGSYCPSSVASCTSQQESSHECSGCPHNHWCYNNTRTPCAANEKAPENSTSRSQCRCADGFYRHPLGACAVCPLHHVCKNETLRPVSQYDENLRTLSTGTVDLRDAVCVAGMFRTARTDLCKLCPRNFYCPQSGVALPNVVRCPENQFTYEPGATSPGDCVCLAGFRLLGNNEEARCLPCGIGERCQGGEVVEEMCHLQNKVASADHQSCVCQAGFGLVNFECAACPPGHVKPLAGDTQCLPCAMDTYAVNATTCLQCPERSEARPASSICQCAAPYVWTANATCELCATNHFWEGGACHACPVLASSDPTPGMLLGPPGCRCAPGHLAVPQNVSGELKCTECAAGTYEGGGECRACGDGAWAPASSTAASACVCNERPNASSTCHTQRVDGTCAGECASTPADCTQCLPGHYKAAYSTPGNSETCSACTEGHFQTAAGASACDQCPQHEWHELLRQASIDVCLCVPGFARPPRSNETGTVDKSPCQACTPGHYKDWLGEQQCLACAVGRYNPDVQSTICRYCSDATADSEAWLRAIAPDIAAGVADNSTRMVLESNTTVRAAAVSVLECVCEVGQEPRAVGDFSSCRQCMQGSFQEHKRHEHCTYCGGLSVDHGHSLLHHYGLPGAGVTDFTHCAACPVFSGQNETLVGPGKLRMNDVSGCLCFPGHERVLSELASECRNCSQYMIQTTISNDACNFCPAGHFFIDRHIPCQLCDLPEDGGDRHVGLVLNMLNNSLAWGTSEDDCICRPGFERAFNSQCTACPTGKFRASNLTRLCTACPQDTFQDSLARLSCLACPRNSSTLSLYGSSTVRDCVCGPGFQPLSLLDSHTGVCQPCAAGTFRTSRMQNESEESCTPCPEDHYCPLGVTTPVSCPRGEVSDASSRTPDDCQCPPGYGRESYASNFDTNGPHVNVSRHNASQSAGVCTLCARGFFADTRSNDACLVCPENKTTTSPGTSNQTACICVSGHGVNTMLPSAPCTPCLSGSFSVGGSNEPCKPCGWGTQTAPFAMPESADTCMCNANLGVRLQTI